MPEPFSADHLNQLRQRWERDPKSRAFLQLAEEYRRAGRLEDAVHVLQAGLKEHPNYLSAQVALGRCLLETGDPAAAAELLERAVARDPTQLVANKLLVEAYLAQGQAAKASERLNLYKLFNDRDAEIEPLEARIRALSGLPATAAGSRKSPPRSQREEVLFDLPAVEALPGMQFEAPPATSAPTVGVPATEPFGVVWAPSAVLRIESAFAQQGIFTLVPAAEIASLATPESLAPVVPGAPLAQVAPPWSAEPAHAEPRTVEPPPADWEAASWPTGTARLVESEPDAAPAPRFEAESENASDAGTHAPFAFAEEIPEPPSPYLPVTAAPMPASSTLGELYLAQGHFDEAEESFQSVLRSRPTDAAALAGLESVRQQRGDEAAVFADESAVVEESSVIVGGLTARKAALLKDYLGRIRRGAQRHVS